MGVRVRQLRAEGKRDRLGKNGIGWVYVYGMDVCISYGIEKRCGIRRGSEIA